MPLNTSQLNTLHEVVRPYIDEIIDNGYSTLIRGVVEPVNLTLQQTIAILKSNLNLINGLANATKIPTEVARDWRPLINKIKLGQDDISNETLMRLKKYPNYYPANIAAMQKFENQIPKNCPEGVKTALINLRELYLEMTPLHHYQYGENYTRFSFRIGNVPFNLNNFGPQIIHGEISQEVESFVTYRVELHDKYVAQVKMLSKKQIEENTKKCMLKLQQEKEYYSQLQHDALVRIKRLEEEKNQILEKFEEIQEHTLSSDTSHTAEINENKNKIKALEIENVYYENEMKNIKNKIDENIITGNNLQRYVINKLFQPTLPSANNINDTKSLFFYKQNIEPENINLIIDTIKRNPKKSVIELQQNRIGALGSELLFKSLMNLPHVKILNLWRNEIGDEGSNNIAKYLTYCKINAIDINENMISDKSIQCLALAIAYNNTLSYVNLGFNPLNDNGAILLAESLQDRCYPLLDLRVAGCNIGAKGAQALINLMTNNPGIIYLDLDNNPIPDYLKKELIQLNNKCQKIHTQEMQKNNLLTDNSSLNSLIKNFMSKRLKYIQAKNEQTLALKKIPKIDASDFEIIHEYSKVNFAIYDYAELTVLYSKTKHVISLRQELNSIKNIIFNYVSQLHIVSQEKLKYTNVNNKKKEINENIILTGEWKLLKSIGISEPSTAFNRLKIYPSNRIIVGFLRDSILDRMKFLINNNIISSIKPEDEFYAISNKILDLHHKYHMSNKADNETKKLDLMLYLERLEVQNAYLDYIAKNKYEDFNIASACLDIYGEKLGLFVRIEDNNLICLSDEEIDYTDNYYKNIIFYPNENPDLSYFSKLNIKKIDKRQDNSFHNNAGNQYSLGLFGNNSHDQAIQTPNLSNVNRQFINNSN